MNQKFQKKGRSNFPKKKRSFQKKKRSFQKKKVKFPKKKKAKQIKLEIADGEVLDMDERTNKPKADLARHKRHQRRSLSRSCLLRGVWSKGCWASAPSKLRQSFSFPTRFFHCSFSIVVANFCINKVSKSTSLEVATVGDLIPPTLSELPYFRWLGFWPIDDFLDVAEFWESHSNPIIGFRWSLKLLHLRYVLVGRERRHDYWGRWTIRWRFACLTHFPGKEKLRVDEYWWVRWR